MRRIMLVAGLLGLAQALTGCGPGTISNSSSQSRSLGGYAIDGYLAGAEIRCLDSAGKVLATATSASTGAWVMRVPDSTPCQVLESEGGVDVGRGIGSPAERTALPPGTRFSAHIGHLDRARLGGIQVVISPLTSLSHSLQTQRGMSASEARSAVLLALGLPVSLDPLIDNPISSGNVDLFGSGVLTATMIRETTTGILDAIAGSGQTLTTELRRQAHQRVTDSFAEQLQNGNLTRQALGDDEPGPDSPLATMIAGALARLNTAPQAIAGAVSGLQFDSVRTIVAQYAGKTGSQLTETLISGNVGQIAERAAALSLDGQANLQRPQVLAALGTERELDLNSVAAAVRGAISVPAGSVRVRRGNGAELEILLNTTLKDYLQIAGEQLWFYTTTTGAAGRSVPVADFELGRAQALPGALSAVALSFTQRSDSTLLVADSEKTVTLAFRVERIDPTGVNGIRLGAIVDGIRIRWSDRGLVVRTPADAKLYGAVRIGATTSDLPLEISNSNDRIANLVATTDGMLRIDLAAFLTELGLPAGSILQGYLGTGTMAVEAVISGVVFARGEGSSLRKRGDASITLDRGGNSTALTVTGAGLRGSVTVGQ